MSYARIALNMNEFAEQEKQALLTKLRDEVGGLGGIWVGVHLYHQREDVLALIEKAGGEG